MPNHRTQGQSHYFSSNEAAVLGQLREQKPSASSENATLWNWVENEESTENESPHERVISKITSLHEKLVSEEEMLIMKELEKVRSHLFLEKAKSETASLHSSYVSEKFMETQEEEVRMLQKICSERKRLMEAPEKEVRSH